MSEWRDIETAPKDGTRVLLQFPKPFLDKLEDGVSVGAWLPPGMWFLSCIWAASAAHRAPIRWMAIPELPVAS